jgi:hypothetical protein
MIASVTLAASLALLGWPCAVPAQPHDADRGWLEAGAGGGWVRIDREPPKDRAAFALDVGGGLWVGERLGLGLRLGGWTLGAFNFWEPSEGESVSEAFLAARFRPFGSRVVDVSVESGWVSYAVNDPARVLLEGDGLGWRIGASWNLAISERLVLAPSVVRSWGGIDPDLETEASFEYSGLGAVVMLGWSW